ncbi:MAG TPA: TlpA family protein disulfide reductase [Candidatus Coprenecus stercoravium]|uniref:TlpA family protein disulfide reductase n=1 Tax=Candidatus Coprenecus stercoravium TaxID=2840735 RepID=A0A9D2K996_9BACT|nr:TlpA family protein disulfide reductase [Candidatus Coprenecus stercoravium]
MVWGQKALPSVEVKTLDGDVVNVQSILDDGVPVILSFWYTTCKPCLQELGAMNDAFVDWSEEADFKIVAVSTDDSRSSAKVAPMVNGRGWTDFTFLLDENGDLKRAMNVQTQPMVFIIDKDGNVVDKHIGYTPGSEEEYFDKILTLQ